MKVRALTSFVGYGTDADGNPVRVVAHEGFEFELPLGTDWVNCGFVEVLAVPEGIATGKSGPRNDTVNRRKPRREAVRDTGEKAVE